MPTSWELYKTRHTELSYCKTDGEAASILAARYGMSASGLRSSLSKANNLKNKLRLSDYLVKHPEQDVSVVRQNNIIDESNKLFKENQHRLSQLPRLSCGVFISDKHIPVHRKDAWKLAVKIIEDLPYVDYITAGNDWCDHQGYGRWEDVRSPRERLWTSDIQNQENLEKHDMETLKMAAPDAVLLYLMGNHDRWWYDYLRRYYEQGAEKEIADRMEWLFNLGVLQFGRGNFENYIELSPKLIWVHGKWQARLHTTNARNILRQFIKEGKAPNVVVGHTHRPAVVEGESIGIPGVKVVNSGCMCKSHGHNYLKLGFANEWRTGITICYFKPGLEDVRIDSVVFNEKVYRVDSNQNEVGHLSAIVNGKMYSVPLDKS